jgi:hypothetical protein
MEKTLLTILLLFSLIITACSNTQANSTQESTDLPATTELVIGTLKLEGTEQEVTREQAQELLVMWQAYRELASSDTAAQAEIDGLIEQIQETMTEEQLGAVSAMNLTQQDISALMQGQSVATGSTQRSSSSTVTQSNTGFVPPDGGGGAPPDGGMAGELGGVGGPMPDSSASQSQTASEGQGVSISTKVPIALVGALIQYLEQRSGV